MGRRARFIHRPASPRSAAAATIIGAMPALPMRSSCVSLSPPPDSHDMVIARRYDPQNEVSLVTRRPRNVAQRLFAAQADVEHLARLHALEPQLGAHEGHGTDLAGNVYSLVRGSGHGFNYTAPALQCRLHRDA